MSNTFDKPGPAGPDRRWKLACEEAFGREFNTPRELMNLIGSTKDSLAVALEALKEAQEKSLDCCDSCDGGEVKRILVKAIALIAAKEENNA